MTPLSSRAIDPPAVAAVAGPGGRVPLGRCELDLARGELWLRGGGGMAPLRPRALRLLLVLARQAGHVVSRDELMAAVWPGLVVVDSSLAQAVVDIRRVLGPQGRTLLRTVARRGYMLDLPPLPGDQRPAARPALPWLSVAVLPFESPAGDPLVAAAAAAVHADLITELARLPSSRLVSRASVLAACADATGDPRQLAAALSVRHVVQASVRREGAQLRWNVVLMDGATGVQRWSDVFLLPLPQAQTGLGVFVVQIERALQAALYRACAADAALASQTDADGLAVQAFALWFSGFHRSNVERGIALLSDAVRIDPDAPRAWAGLGFMTYSAWSQGWEPDREVALERLGRVVRALERLDRDGNYTYQAKAIWLGLRGDLEVLLPHAREWCERHRHPTAHGTLGAIQLACGEPEAAVQSLRYALQLSPRDPFRAEWQHRLAAAHFALGENPAACDWSRLAAQTNTALVWPPIHAAALARLGDRAAALAAVRDHLAQHGAWTEALFQRLLPGRSPRWTQTRAALQHTLASLLAECGDGACPRNPRSDGA